MCAQVYNHNQEMQPQHPKKEETDMTITEWMDNNDYHTQQKLAALLESWLGMYTQEVFEHVMKQIDEIISSESTMKMLEELHSRMQKEQSRRVDSIWFGMKELSEGEKKLTMSNLHNDVISHSQSYRDVLYDLYIRDRKEEEA